MTITDVVLSPPIPLNEKKKKLCCGFGHGSELVRVPQFHQACGSSRSSVTSALFQHQCTGDNKKITKHCRISLNPMCRLSYIVFFYQPILHF